MTLYYGIVCDNARTFQFAIDGSSNRALIISYWIFIVSSACYVASLWTELTTTSSVVVNLRRKFFHACVIILFVPVYFIDVIFGLTLA